MNLWPSLSPVMLQTLGHNLPPKDREQGQLARCQGKPPRSRSRVIGSCATAWPTHRLFVDFVDCMINALSPKQDLHPSRRSQPFNQICRVETFTPTNMPRLPMSLRLHPDESFRSDRKVGCDADVGRMPSEKVARFSSCKPCKNRNGQLALIFLITSIAPPIHPLPFALYPVFLERIDSTRVPAMLSKLWVPFPPKPLFRGFAGGRSHFVCLQSSTIGIFPRAHDMRPKNL